MSNSELIFEGSVLEIWSKDGGIVLSLPGGDVFISKSDDFLSFVDDLTEYCSLDDREDVNDNISNLYHLRKWLDQGRDESDAYQDIRKDFEIYEEEE